MVTRQIDRDFGELHRRMQWWVDGELLSCAATVVMQGDDVVDVGLFGFMDVETREPLRVDGIHRIYSNTKLITSVAAMMLHERELFDLDDPIEEYLPDFADMRVLKDGATSMDETVLAEHSITPRHLLCHTAGLSYGFLEPESLIDRGYAEAFLNGFDGDNESLADLCQHLAQLPLAFQPGTQWRYSFATDAVAHLVEVLSGDSFDTFLEESILSPLEMVDTGFHVPKDKHDRFVTMYSGTDPLDHTAPGFVVADDPVSGSFSQPRDLLLGGGGLVSTLHDYINFMQMLINGGEWRGRRIISEDTLRLMRTNQLPEGVHVNFPDLDLPGTGFGLGFSLLEQPQPDYPTGSRGEYGWRGMAGTAAFIAPDSNVAGICFTQRMPAAQHPYIEEFSRLVYQSTPDGDSKNRP
jgi:CubicO group peptidase (beta-lactamase class C family)